MNLVIKILKNILTNLIQQCVKRIIYHDRVGFTPGMHSWFNVWMNHQRDPLYTQAEDETMAPLMKKEKHLTKSISHSWQTVSNLAVEGIFLSLINWTYKNLQPTLCLWSKSGCSPPRRVMSRGGLLPPPLLNMVLKVSSQSDTARKQNKFLSEQEKVKLF